MSGKSHRKHHHDECNRLSWWHSPLIAYRLALCAFTRIYLSVAQLLFVVFSSHFVKLFIYDNDMTDNKWQHQLPWLNAYQQCQHSSTGWNGKSLNCAVLRRDEMLHILNNEFHLLTIFHCVIFDADATKLFPFFVPFLFRFCSFHWREVNYVCVYCAYICHSAFDGANILII